MYVCLLACYLWHVNIWVEYACCCYCCCYYYCYYFFCYCFFFFSFLFFTFPFFIIFLSRLCGIRRLHKHSLKFRFIPLNAFFLWVCVTVSLYEYHHCYYSMCVCVSVCFYFSVCCCNCFHNQLCKFFFCIVMIPIYKFVHTNFAALVANHAENTLNNIFYWRNAVKKEIIFDERKKQTIETSQK